MLLRAEMVEHLNRAMTGWANYFCLGQVSPAYHAIDRHAVKRLRQWLCRKHKVRSGGYVRFSDERLRETYGLTCLVRSPEPSVGEGMISTESRMRENRTSGLTSGGEETLLRKRLRHR